MLIKNAELDGKTLTDLRCNQGLIVEIADRLQSFDGEYVIDAQGGALLPGLHDHHIHLYSLAASHCSVTCGPPQVTNSKQLAKALAHDKGEGWLRAIGYHDSVAGELTRWQLDQYISDRPVRVQHRSGKMWIVNSLAAEILQLDKYKSLPGVHCNDNGQVTGRLFRLDNWMRDKLGTQALPDIQAVSQLLASYGISGITDATPSNSASMVSQLSAAITHNKLLQRVELMGAFDLPEPDHPLLTRGAVKLLLDEHKLPEFEVLINQIQKAHQQNRGVAIHCVTRTELIFSLSALLAGGKHTGDRIEHASVTPNEALPLMQEAQVSIVTQPGFINERGDQYLVDVKAEHHELLYRGKTFLESGIPLAGSSDAPYGPIDPWLTMRAAVERCSANGTVIGEQERLTPEQALALFTSPAHSPGKNSRKIEVGACADLCLLDRGWQFARKRLDSRDVKATIRQGELIYCRR